MVWQWLVRLAPHSRRDRTLSQLGGKIDKEDLTEYLKKTRENRETARDPAKSLMQKMLDIFKSKDPGGLDTNFGRQGYLYVMEKNPLESNWVKHYCIYEKANRKFTMIAYNQISGNITDKDEITLKSCTRRMSDSINKIFCFDIISDNKSGIIYTLKALSEEDLRLWLEAMDGLELMCGPPANIPKPVENILNDVGFNFVQECIEELETRRLEEQGLYRLVGAGSKVAKLLQMGLDQFKIKKLELSDPGEWETKTITSAVKTYFQNLPEPVIPFDHCEAFIAAAKHETTVERISDVHALVHQLPPDNYRILEMLILHLQNVASKAGINGMTANNLGVCFGPILLRPERETQATIKDIKFRNVVVEILIENADLIFYCKPEVWLVARRICQFLLLLYANQRDLDPNDI